MLTFAPGLDRLIGGSKPHEEACRALRENVTFTVAPKTVSGEPIQARRDVLHASYLDGLRPIPEAEDRAVKYLEGLGFEILHRGEFGTTVRGPARLVADVLKIELGIQALPRRTSVRATQNFAMSYEPPAPADLYVAPTESLSIPSTIHDAIDHFVFMPPPNLCATSPVPPSHGYFGIDPAAIQRLLNVSPGATGAGVTVGIVDTGFFVHPYYAANGFDYRPTPTPTVADPHIDPVGHGTAMAFNILAVAPRATVKGFKRIDSQPHIAMEEADRLGADVISCSWGWRDEQRFPIVEATINAILGRGRVVVFATGDGEQAWPATMPGVLAVGGVYADENFHLEASNYASGFLSNHTDYGNRRVPDVCGLCGQRPKGIYIMLPCQPNSKLDRDYAGLRFPRRDETAAGDGWFSASGTSAATAQVAGVAALMVERARTQGRSLTTADVRTVLQQTATPVQRGRNAQGVAAVGHPNTAVGFGLVNAAAAIASL